MPTSYIPGRHTLFMVRATGGRTLQQLHGGDPIGNYEIMVGQRLDPKIWNIVDVPYDGDQLTLDAFTRMEDTSGQGTTALIERIKNTPGKFALAGTSQGAIVISNVYDELRTGDLQDRRSDLLTGITFGNPRRQSGHTIPGGVDPGGAGTPLHGILGGHLLAGSEGLWWDFANKSPVDPISGVGDDAFGHGLQLVFQFLFENATGANTLIADLTTAFNGGFFAGVVTTLQDVITMGNALLTLFIMGLNLTVVNDINLNGSGHLRYHFPYTNLPGNTTKSAVDLAVDHLNAVAANTPPALVPAPPVPPSRIRSAADIRAMNEKLLRGDLITRAEAADMMAEAKPNINRDWRVTIYDKFWNLVGYMGDDLIELSGTDPRNNVPSATLKFKTGSEHFERFMNCTETLVGVIVETGGLRMPFYVDTLDVEYNSGKSEATANLLGIWDILNYMQIFPNSLLPLQAQIPSHAVYVWGLCTVIESMTAETALRMQSGWMEFINNALSLNTDMRTWFGTLLQNNGNIFEMLKTPMYVVRGNPFLDGSPLVAKTVRMESVGKTIIDITKAYGVDVVVELWLPGDPQPDQWANLDQPTYVVKVRDRSQISGPTGTVIDSVVRTVVDVGGSFFGGIGPVFKGVPGMDGVFQSPALGVNYVPPWPILVVPENGQKGSVLSCKMSFHTPKGYTHIVGGRSPKWLNDLMNATFAWIIDSISILLGVTGIPSNLLDGFLNNSFLAFQQIQDYNRRNDVGPYHPAKEVFHATASAPYNIETVFAFINALWDSRGYVSAQAMFRNGDVYTIGVDIFKSQLVSILYHNRTRLFTDFIEIIHFSLTQKERVVMAQVGDGKAEESRLASLQRLMTGVMESINVLTLAPQS